MQVLDCPDEGGDGIVVSANEVAMANARSRGSVVRILVEATDLISNDCMSLLEKRHLKHCCRTILRV
jgi:hypothetical protein